MSRVTTRVSSSLFIGRQAELQRIMGAVERAGAGEAAVVLVGGEAGIGKTRLMDEVGGRSQDLGALLLEGGCVSLGDGGGLPFAPIVEALRRLPAALAGGKFGAIDVETLRTPATVELGRLLPEFGTPAAADAEGPGRPEWIQARIFEGVLALLRGLGERAPVVCVLEDLHWADSSTRDLVAFLARNVRTEPLVVIGTYRTDELHRRHPLRPWLAEMDRLPRVQRMELARFGREELSAQVEAIIGHAPETELLDAIGRRAEGNPFFIEELLAAGGGTAVTGLSETLRDVLLSRVSALSEGAQRILGIAAVDGRSVDPTLLAEVAARPESDLEEPIREALAAQLLVSDIDEGRYRFRHALLAEAVYDDLLPSERRRIHAAYGATLDARPVPDGAEGASLLAALAHHATAAHEPVRALRAWIAAARAAAASYAFAESVRSFEHAIELWDVVPADDRPSGVDASTLHHEASLGAMIIGRLDLAVDLARVAVELVDPVRDPERWAAANERLARASWVAGATQEATDLLESTAATMERSGPSPERARVLAALAGAYMLRGGHARAIPVAEAAIDLARSTHAALPEAHAMSTLGTSLVPDRAVRRRDHRVPGSVRSQLGRRRHRRHRSGVRQLQLGPARLRFIRGKPRGRRGRGCLGTIRWRVWTVRTLHPIERRRGRDRAWPMGRCRADGRRARGGEGLRRDPDGHPRRRGPVPRAARSLGRCSSAPRRREGARGAVAGCTVHWAGARRLDRTGIDG